MEKRILLAAFRNTSAETMLNGVAEYDTLLLPNDKQKDGELLIRNLQLKTYDLVICLGQRPNIKDKVHVETTAKESRAEFKSKIDCDELVRLFEHNGIHAKLSNNAGTSYCNALYFSGLQYIADKDLNCRMVFIHIPFQKNMCDPVQFQKRFLDVVKELKKKGDGCFGKIRCT